MNNAGSWYILNVVNHDEHLGGMSMTWYACEIELSVHLPMSSLNGFHQAARSVDYLRRFQTIHEAYLLGPDEAHRRAVRDLLQSPVCRFLLRHHPVDAAGQAFPSMDDMRARVVSALNEFNGANLHLKFDTSVPLGDPQTVRTSFLGTQTRVEFVYGLVATFEDPAAIKKVAEFPPANYQVSVRVTDAGR